MNKKTAFFHDERCLWHTTGMAALFLPVGGWVQPPSGASAAESPESKRRFKSLMDVSGLSDKLYISTAEMATDEDLLRVHDKTYIENFKALSDKNGGELGDTAPFGKGSYEIAKLSVGLAKAAIFGVLEGKYKNAYSLSRPPGHHCLAHESMGFCLLANIPIAVEAAKVAFGIKKIVVLDWDVHHGNGTQAIYYKDASVFTISIHQEFCFPPGYSGNEDIGEGAGKGFNLNIPLLAGMGHEAYIYALKNLVIPAIEAYQPELIIVACGFDANGVDPLARMQAHSETFREMTELIMQTANKCCDGKLVMVHEGGYSEAYVPFCGHATMEALSGKTTEVIDPCLDLIKLQQPSKIHNDFQFGLLDEMRAIRK